MQSERDFPSTIQNHIKCCVRVLFHLELNDSCRQINLWCRVSSLHTIHSLVQFTIDVKGFHHHQMVGIILDNLVKGVITYQIFHQPGRNGSIPLC